MEFFDFIKVPRLENVYLYESQQPKIEGTLVISSHHLIFSQRTKEGCQQPAKEIWILHRMVDVVERRSHSTMLYLKCKDLEWLKLDIPGVDNCAAIAESIECLSNIGGDSIHLCYPFFYRPLFKSTERLKFSATVDLPSNGKWRFFHGNSNYTLCPSYPSVVIVPAACTDQEVVESAEFRQYGRFPVLCFEDTTGAVLMRSGQPLVGPANRRSRSDEKLLNSVIFSDKKGLIMDLRTPQQTQVAKSKGGGIEPENMYNLWRKHNKPIELGVDSYSKFIDACSDEGLSVDKWLSKVESSGWLGAVKDTIHNACVTAQCLRVDGVSVLIHGSDGMDTTLAVCSLVQLILNPSLRTIRGLMGIIEREWLQAGHPFHRRYQHGPFSSQRTKENIPTFILFLDCLSQLLYQFPCSFEFNTELLVLLASDIYASSFGTFLCNSQMERQRHKLEEKTVSLWTYVEQPEIRKTMENPLYEPNDEVIWPSVAPQSMQLWNSFYLRRRTCDRQQEKIAEEMIRKIVDDDREVTNQVIKLRAELDRLLVIKKMRDASI